MLALNLEVARDAEVFANAIQGAPAQCVSVLEALQAVVDNSPPTWD